MLEPMQQIVLEQGMDKIFQSPPRQLQYYRLLPRQLYPRLQPQLL